MHGLKLKLAIAAAAAVAAPVFAAGPAAAAWLPLSLAAQEMAGRLAVIQTHQTPAEQFATADNACAILRGNQTAAGRLEALKVVERAGYRDPFAKGWALGVMADVRCADLTWVLTHAL